MTIAMAATQPASIVFRRIPVVAVIAFPLMRYRRYRLKLAIQVQLLHAAIAPLPIFRIILIASFLLELRCGF
jgi:hypothetical protein